ncbi:MAG: phycobilisome protein [Phormidesmis sp.]
MSKVKDQNQTQGLSERAKQLIPQARIVSFTGWDGIAERAIAQLQTADDEKQYPSDADLAVISAAIAQPDPAMATAGVDAIAAVQQLREQAADIVDEARAGVLQAFPGILEPGGGLYPPLRADACWRDFWHFLRCITYGIAGQQAAYTSPEGLAAMEQLYEELQVPLPAMVEGLKGIKKASLKRFSASAQPALAPYFDHLIAQLSAFLQRPD